MPARSRLGQNFLHDAAAIQRIIAALGDCSQRLVVEIGPGKGAITRLLAERARHVLAIELDPVLAARLRDTFPPERVTVAPIDVLNFDFAAAAAGAGERLVVVGNLPYYITSPILLKLAENAASLDFAVLMVQREVADRVAAAPGSRDYGLLTVTVQLHGPVQTLFTLPPEAFSPPPEVHSTVFRWRFQPRFTALGIDPTSFTALLRQAFAQKRKTLANNLRAAGYSADHIQAALSIAAIQPTTRAEALSIDELAALWKSLAATQGAGAAAPEVN
ncbi:MAG: ribosomal RNA small subunit methyltransferase A [Acidobacteriota bacterium]|nr:ribosomal RNA small subunit methyltransferase A [Acidobacteriota bacterium]